MQKKKPKQKRLDRELLEAVGYYEQIEKTAPNPDIKRIKKLLKAKAVVYNIIVESIRFFSNTAVSHIELYTVLVT